MISDNEMGGNKIGFAIQYFRETYNISQSKLCKGLCSVATLSRIETGERDVDSLLLETLLERLGKTPNLFELILTDFDYVSYQNREEIKKYIENKNYKMANTLLEKYEQIAASKGSVHNQFIITMKAFLNELQGGPVERTIELFMEAITYTVPDFKTNKIIDYYLSNIELNIIINIIERMISVTMIDKAKELLSQLMLYFDRHDSIEDTVRQYPQIAIIASRFYLQEQDLNMALEICNKGLDKDKGNRKMNYKGELFYIKAQVTEALYKNQMQWEMKKKECLKLYLQAFYIFELSEEKEKVEQIKNHIKEEYQWEGID